MIGISGDTREDLEFIATLLETRAIRPVIDDVYPLARIADAHTRVEGRHKRGSVVVTVVEPEGTYSVRDTAPTILSICASHGIPPPVRVG